MLYFGYHKGCFPSYRKVVPYQTTSCDSLTSKMILNFYVYFVNYCIIYFSNLLSSIIRASIMIPFTVCLFSYFMRILYIAAYHLLFVH